MTLKNGIDSAVSKPADMWGNQIDAFGAAAGGWVIALGRLLVVMPHLTVLPRFGQLKVPAAEDLTVIIQGFGAVGAHTSRQLVDRFPAAKVVGISDFVGYLYDPSGLWLDKLLRTAKQHGLVTRRYYETEIAHKATDIPPNSQPVPTLCCGSRNSLPVGDDKKVLGMVNSDLLAQRYLMRLLRSQAPSD
jgi:glutamate dehydrogenase (NAD(P)+)